MKNYVILACAVCCEVTGSMALKQAAEQPLWMLLTLVADAIAFTLLAWLLKRGMALSVAYGLWGAAGVALTALMGTLVFGEPFTGLMGAGILLVIAGVLTVEFGAKHGDSDDDIRDMQSFEDRLNAPGATRARELEEMSV